MTSAPLHARRLGIGMRRAGGIEMAFERMVHRADELLLVEQRPVLLRFLDRDQLGRQRPDSGCAHAPSSANPSGPWLETSITPPVR